MRILKRIGALVVIWFGLFFPAKIIDLAELPYHLTPVTPLFMFWAGMIYHWISQKIDPGDL